MDRRSLRWLIVSAVVVAAAGWVAWPGNAGIHIDREQPSIHIHKDISVHQGLDLRGGLRVLLEADVPPDQEIERGQLETARLIIENRVNALGVTEPLVQVQGKRRIVVELPGIEDPEQAIATIKETGLLEFVDVGPVPPPPGTPIQTDFGLTTATTPNATVYHTVMTGAALKSVSVTLDQNQTSYVVAFELTEEATQLFAEYTLTHIGQPLAIVLDKVVISAPRIESAIPDGKGQISGQFDEQSANALAVQLRYGSLPIPFKVVQSETVGPTLGQDSVRKSVLAGAIGLATVIAFMALYYRLPGLVADVALAAYALITFALFKWIPVTLTLPGIAGFVLSVGVAVDANILIFERLKEELRAGRELWQAVDIAFRRAWPSIRDSNISTLITCGILYWFGSTFGASIVKGFAFTLAVGVVVSLFTAIVVTRSLMHLVLDRVELSERREWFGI